MAISEGNGITEEGYVCHIVATNKGCVSNVVTQKSVWFVEGAGAFQR